ncbi:dUTP diphosphatase [Acetobacteraceae bacterium]|nr:dUTP diphosphatase [Acetobacteraceae bacterium]
MSKAYQISFSILEDLPYADKVVFPTKSTQYSSGYDLHSAVDKIIPAGKYVMIPTGLRVHLENDSPIDMQVRSRSGLAAKHGIFTLNSPGTIDQDYEGELKVILMNLGEKDFEVKAGDRIAQAVFCLLANVELPEATVHDKERGKGGFGSTGIGEKKA